MKKTSTKFITAIALFLGLGANAQAPVVDFTWTPANPCPGQTVQITGIVTSGTVTTWGYSLTGATAASTLVQSPVVTFTMGGVQTVTLIGLNGITPSQAVVKSVTLVANPVMVTSTSNTVCSGGSATLTATGGTSYVWAPVTSTMATAVISPTTVGNNNYTVSATASVCPGYTWTTVFTETVVTCVGLKEVSNATFAGLYPNPASNNVTLEFTNNSVKNISVMDLTGRVVFTTSTSDEKIALNLSNLNDGVYFVRINSNNKTEIAKLIKN
jgi:hypothetical protein